MTDAEAIRSNFLPLFDNKEMDSMQLQNLLNRIEERNPEILKPEQNKSLLCDENIESYYQNKARLKDPKFFSRERIEYLIKLREYFRKIRAKGFVPASSKPIYPKENGNIMSENYTPPKNLKQFVDEGDISTIRTSLQLQLNNNRLTSDDLKKAVNWTKKKVSDLFEPYVEKEFAREMKADQSLWTSKYYDSQTGYLETNFSEERLLHLIEVRDLLRTRNEDGFEPIKPMPKEIDNSVQSAPNRSSPNSTEQLTNLQSYTGLKIALSLIGGACALFFITYLFNNRQ